MQPLEQGTVRRWFGAALGLALMLTAAPGQAAPSVAMCQARYAAMAAKNRQTIARGMAAYKQTLLDKRDEAHWTAKEKAAIAAMAPLLDSRTLPADETDLKILERANALLVRPAVWNRHDTRDCPEGAPTLSLYCALHDASIQLTGKYEHRRTALQEVRFAIQDTVGHDLDHRMMDYNNMATTSFGDIKALLYKAEARIRDRLARQARCDL